MPQSDQEDSSSNKEALASTTVAHTPDTEGSSSNIVATRPATESNKSWSSTLMTLLGGSRNVQDVDNEDNENEKIDEELTW